MTEPTPFTPEPPPATSQAAVLGQWIERAAALDLLAAVPAPLRPRIDPFVAREPGVIGYGAPGLASMMLSRVFIGGERAQASAHAVSSVLERFAARGVGSFFAHVAREAATPEVIAALRAHGVERYSRAWVKLAIAPGAVPERSCAFALREAGSEDSAAFAELVVRNQGVSEHALPLIAALVGRPRWHVYVANEGARVVAAGALFVLGDVGYLGCAATDPEQRGRGAQSALLAKRLRVAFALGCRWVFSDTGEAVAGKPNPSHDNMLRLGLRPLFTRDNYAPSGAVL
jgi:GNAT superfamily N-acetyltransferase